MEVAGWALLAFMANVCSQLVKEVGESVELKKNNNKTMKTQGLYQELLPGSGPLHTGIGCLLDIADQIKPCISLTITCISLHIRLVTVKYLVVHDIVLLARR